MVKVRVLLVDDDALVRAGLRMILSSSEELEVVGEAADGADAVATARTLRPDVVLMDIRMPGMDGIAATAVLRRLANPPHVIVLTTFQADEHVMSALRAGADGFLLKDTAPTEIVKAVRLVAAGEAMLSPSVTRTLLAHLGNDEVTDRRRFAAQQLASLTDREREVATAVAVGASNAEVAASLFMSEATVKAHVSRLLTKLAVANRVHIAILVHDAQS
ncbi:MAG: response regulator transcription factor [Actinobacteria bacterium]|nr:response regulator transcription factor [Actinomycetota bacterium]